MRPIDFADGQPPAVDNPSPESAGSAGPESAAGAGRPRARLMGKTRTWVITAMAVALVLIVATAVAGLVGTWRPARTDRTPRLPAPSAAAEPTPAPVLLPAGTTGTAPSAAGVRAALDPLIKSAALGHTVNASVVDVASGDALYDRNADLLTTPASTTKLLTAAAILATRGPAYRLTTTAVAGRTPGEVVLVGGGDPTLAVDAKAEFAGAARLDRLAAQVKAALGDTRPTRVLVDTSLFRGPETAKGWSSDDIAPLGQVARIQSLMTNAGRIRPVHHEHGGDPRFPDPAIAAGQAFARLLGAQQSTVARGSAPRRPAATPSAAPQAVATPSTAPQVVTPGSRLGAVQSPPMVQLTDWMLEQSDNTIAEVLGRQVAIAAGKPASFDGATDAIIGQLRDLGLMADEANLYDASGLSRHNGISPALLTQLLAYAASGQQPALSAMFGGMPVAGWSGTLEDRFGGPAATRLARGLVRAKTGTLSGVSTMAGVLVTADGRLLVFAIMANGAPNAYTAKAAIDRVPARLVACGC